MSLADLASDVLAWDRRASKHEWGLDLLARVEDADDDALNEEVREKLIGKLGDYVAGVKAAAEKARQAERMLAVGYNGRPITPTVSVRNEDGSTQTMLWIDASPAQFMDAVLREQSVVDGRLRSNIVRLKVVDMLRQDDCLMDLPTLQDVCNALGVNPDTLGLDELDTGS